MKKKKMLVIPNVHPGCRVKVIDDGRWKTLGECLDAPNPIREIMLRNDVTVAWIFDGFGKRMVRINHMGDLVPA